MAKSMNNKDINNLLSGKISDTDQRVLYEEKIDLGELHNTVFGFYDNAMAKMNQSKEMINTIEDEFAKINNSKKFYYGGDAAHQHGNLSIASQHFDDLQTVSPIFNDPASMTRMAEIFNKTLVEKKHKVRVTLCQQKIDAINENRTVVETRTEKKLSNGILPDKTVQLDDIYEEIQENEPKSTEIMTFVLTREHANTFREKIGKDSRKIRWNDITVRVFL